MSQGSQPFPVIWWRSVCLCYPCALVYGSLWDFIALYGNLYTYTIVNAQKLIYSVMRVLWQVLTYVYSVVFCALMGFICLYSSLGYPNKSHLKTFQGGASGGYVLCFICQRVLICLYMVILAHCGLFISVCGKLLACAPCVRSGGIYGGTWSSCCKCSSAHAPGLVRADIVT
jgi:hypothetical protein